MESIGEVLALLSNSSMRMRKSTSWSLIIEDLTYNPIPISISSVRLVHGRNINLSSVYEPILLQISIVQLLLLWKAV